VEKVHQKLKPLDRARERSYTAKVQKPRGGGGRANTLRLREHAALQAQKKPEKKSLKIKSLTHLDSAAFRTTRGGEEEAKKGGGEAQKKKQL